MYVFDSFNAGYEMSQFNWKKEAAFEAVDANVTDI